MYTWDTCEGGRERQGGGSEIIMRGTEGLVYYGMHSEYVHCEPFSKVQTSCIWNRKWQMSPYLIPIHRPLVCNVKRHLQVTPRWHVFRIYVQRIIVEVCVRAVNKECMCVKHSSHHVCQYMHVCTHIHVYNYNYILTSKFHVQSCDNNYWGHRIVTFHYHKRSF